MHTLEHKTEWIEAVSDRIKTLRFGKIELVIHQGKVTQIETTEKVRFEPLAPQPTDSQRGFKNGSPVILHRTIPA